MSSPQQQQVRIGDSPTDHVAATLSIDFISSTSKTRTLLSSPSAASARAASSSVVEEAMHRQPVLCR